MKRILLAIGMLVSCAVAEPITDRGPLVLDSIPQAHFKFTGPIGDRVDANVDNWLLRAPQSNPGMLEMFRVRDRRPVPQLVPWAGEFVGKYLVSAILALRTSDDPRLFQQVSNVVTAFIATQADDGYLGPFPQDIRLLKNWDLWGHYHALCALALWHQETGDRAALEAARKAGDLVCRTYLNSGRHVYEAGDAEMNMSILTGMALLHRITGEPKYLQMALEVEKDWERAGDYLRAGLDGREYFQCPRPRWESLHDLQGLFELWRITGEPKYRNAFVHHWRSIRRWDRRNTGAFSSGEQATGNPYTPSAIETCCTVAWLALSVDYLRLTGEVEGADALELGTLNGGIGAQHPSGRWWTYNTPMDGIREASAHTIVFQSRAGTPELNCCSVNGPRILGLLSEWGVMESSRAITINHYLPAEVSLRHGGGQVRLALDKDYPVAQSQRVLIKAAEENEWTMRLRIPGWSAQTSLKANFEGVPEKARPGSYVEIRRRWKTGDEITLEFDFGLRPVAGANEQAGKVSLYRGPLLLAYDQAFNAFDEDKIPPVDLSRLKEARICSNDGIGAGLEPHAWVQIELPVDSDHTLRLVDFASAGNAGTHFRSWLPVVNPPPAPAFSQYPRDGERVRPGVVQFQWRSPRRQPGIQCRLELAADPLFASIIVASNSSAGNRLSLQLPAPSGGASSDQWWRVVTRNAYGETRPDMPPARFTLAGDAAAQTLPPEPKPGPNGELIAHSLISEQSPKFGELTSNKGTPRAGEGTQVNGRDQMMVYAVPAWPEEDFTVSVRFRIDEIPKGKIGQIFSGWAGGMDDPLRLVVDGGKIFARIETGGGFGTPGAPIDAGRWYRAVAVKRGTRLQLFLNGDLAGACNAPEFTNTSARDCALGGNPHFGGNEFLAATFADFGMWARALSVEELRHNAD